MRSTSRRQFLSDTAKIGIASIISAPALASVLPASFSEKNKMHFPIQTGFTQTPLAYAYNALEPSIDAQTMDIHYNKHASAYCKNLNDAAIAEKIDTSKPLEDVLVSISKYSVKMRNNAGGHYNHEMFWKSLQANGNAQPKGRLLTAIEKDFISFDDFKIRFADAAKNRFGSGWAWLIIDNNKKLMIASTPNQDNTLMDIAEVKGLPLLGLDVWEHAYYLHYQNKRAEYIDNFWKIINWDYIQQRFESV